MAKRIIAGLGGLLCLALLAMWQFSAGSSMPVGHEQTAPPEVLVTAGVVIAQDVPQYLHGIGTVQAFNSVAVKSRVDGAIVKVGFTEGQEVQKGDLLFQIDPAPYQAMLALATAVKEKDEAQLATAQGDLARYGKLVGSGYQTRQSYEQQQGQVAQLQAAIKGDQAQIDTAQINLG